MASFRLIILRDEEADRAREVEDLLPSIGDNLVVDDEVVVIRHLFPRPRTPIAIAEPRDGFDAGTASPLP